MSATANSVQLVNTERMEDLLKNYKSFVQRMFLITNLDSVRNPVFHFNIIQWEVDYPIQALLLL